MAVPGGAEVITPALAAPLLAAVLQTESRGIAVTHDRALAMAKRAFVPRLVCRQQPLRRATTSLSQHFHLQGCHLRFKSCSTIATNVTIKSGTRKGGAARSRHSSKDADGTRRRRSRQRLYNHRPARTPRCRDAEETRRWHVSTTTVQHASPDAGTRRRRADGTSLQPPPRHRVLPPPLAKTTACQGRGAACRR